MKLPARYKTVGKGVESGGFGTVIPLEDTYLRRVVLLKTMQDSKDGAQIKNEILGLCSARSRHVVEIYDVVKNDNDEITGVIIERLRGRDFRDFHSEAASHPTTYLKILYQVATALRDLHSAGIIHRDLKLDNFKESSAGIVKLFDFGISSPAGGYKTKENKGTIYYAAPELYIPGAEITPEMDIYAFGICAWLLANPTLPAELKEKPPQQSGRAPSLGTLSELALHPAIANAFDACLDPNPRGRPSAEDLSILLAQHLVKGQHKGLFVQGTASVFELSAAQPRVAIKIGTLGSISVVYDGLIFKVVAVSGSVRINNNAAAVGDILYKGCLLSFGDRSLGAAQQWVTFSSSHPEVIL